ncbi:hypothetical protein OKW46_000291 [Paraburkholderia sp. WSM4179]|nr:hypothetical protein [Paraburkholderia sp. WSM4179]
MRAAVALIRLKRRRDRAVHKSTLMDERTLLHLH